MSVKIIVGMCLSLLPLSSCFNAPRNRIMQNRILRSGDTIMYSNRENAPINAPINALDNALEGKKDEVVVKYWTISDLYSYLEDDQVELAAFSEDSNKVTVLDRKGYEHVIKILSSDVPALTELFRKKKVRFAVAGNRGGFLSGIANIIFPLGLLTFVLYSFRMSNGGMNNNAGGPFGMQNMQNLNFETNTGVSFADVAGCDESKLELMEVVDFLKYPENFTDIGAEAPRGVLLEGPPGTGKTLLAKAVAGEAGVGFVSTSGSEFVEMYVGVGASRVRKMFNDAKKNSPCIIFIDEIDAIGKSRSAGGPGNNDERDQTLNQILSEMDGFSGNTGLIVLAATNRAEILDSALLRPGRFDRRVPVGLPDKLGRFEILKVHARGKKLSKEVHLKDIASRTIGFSGASLKNLLNEAAIVSIRNGKNEIDYDSIDYAIDRITVGIQKPIGPNVKKELVAYHEAGHALMAALTPGYDNVTKVTIIPRTNGAGGFTLFTPSEERSESGLYSQKYLKSQLSVALGGRVAEEIVYGQDEITTGASGDLQRVRELARMMITQWGFRNASDITDFPIAWDSNEPKYGEQSLLSIETENAIDLEIKKVVKQAYNECKEALTKNRDILDGVVDSLIEHETISGEEFNRIVNKYDKK